MAKLVCGNCGYRFETNLENRGKRCPYCGEAKVKLEQDASSLLDEVIEHD